MTSSSPKEKPLLKTTSKDDLEGLWKKALSDGICPFYGCDLTKKTCKHLDNYLDYGRSMFEPRVRLHFVNKDWMEQRSATLVPKESIWDFYKGIRRFHLPNEYTLLVVYRYGLGLSLPEIEKSCGWTSARTLARHVAAALRMLKRRGYNAKRS